MENNSVHYGTGQTSSWQHKLTSRTFLIPLVALLVLAIGVLVFYNLNNSKKEKRAALNNALETSEAAFATGDYQKSTELLKAALDKAQTKEEKVKIYAELSGAVASAGNLTEALNYLDKKHQLDPSTKKLDAYLMATYYERLDDKPKAIEYYKLALENTSAGGSTSSGGVMRGGLRAQLEDKIKSLESQ